MYPDFAYTKTAQMVLLVLNFVFTFIQMYLLANIILKIFKVQAGAKQKALFAFCTGTVLQNIWVYTIYFIGIPFTPAVYMLVVSPNPFFALLYCYVAIRAFRLSPVRSFRIMSYVYLFWVILKNVNRLLNAVFFPPQSQPYNYLIDICQQFMILTVFIIIYALVRLFLNKNYFFSKIADNTFIEYKKEVAIYFLKASFVYAVTVVLPLLVAEQVMVDILINLVLIMYLIVLVSVDSKIYYKQIIETRDMHIDTLSKSAEELRGVKHDFYNILQTYGGFLELGELEPLRRYHASLVSVTKHAGNLVELAGKMADNPAFISLLISKVEYAESMNVGTEISLRCDVADLFIDNLDLCRMLACLLDNAVEAAAESERRTLSMTVDKKAGNAVLIIISNSTRDEVDVAKITELGYTAKAGHSGIGLSTVRSTVDKYGNCTFELKYYNYELSAYLELKG